MNMTKAPSTQIEVIKAFHAQQRADWIKLRIAKMSEIQLITHILSKHDPNLDSKYVCLSTYEFNILKEKVKSKLMEKPRRKVQSYAKLFIIIGVSCVGMAYWFGGAFVAFSVALYVLWLGAAIAFVINERIKGVFLKPCKFLLEAQIFEHKGRNHIFVNVQKLSALKENLVTMN